MSEPLINISSRRAKTFACFLVLYEFLTYIANDMIMPGMLQVVRTFYAPESTVATSLTAYLLGGASLQLFLGPISDAHGRRPMMIFGACLFFLFTILIACSNSMNQFLIARFFQGMGLCFIGVIGYATIQEIFAEMDAIRLIAIMANAAILAPLLGPVLGAVVIHYASWRIIFVVIAFCALFALWGLWRYMPEPIGQRKKDGQIIAKASLSLTSVAKNYWALLTNIRFCSSAMAIGVITIPCMAWIALGPIILIAEAKLTPIQFGLWQLPVFGATILGNWFLHRLTHRFEINNIIFLGCAFMAAAMILLILLPYLYGNNYLCLIPGVTFYFFALSIVSAPLNRYCLYVTPVGKGTVSAIVSLNLMVIGAIGIEIANSFYETHSNLKFSIFCNATGVLFFLFIGLTFALDKKSEPN